MHDPSLHIITALDTNHEEQIDRATSTTSPSRLPLLSRPTPLTTPHPKDFPAFALASMKLHVPVALTACPFII